MAKGLLALHAGNRRGRRSATGTPRGPLIYVGSLALVVTVACLARVYFERRTLAMGLEWERRHEQYTGQLRERDNFMLERESYSDGAHILPRAAARGLQPPVPGQVRRLAEPPLPTAGARGPVVAAGSR